MYDYARNQTEKKQNNKSTDRFKHEIGNTVF